MKTTQEPIPKWLRSYVYKHGIKEINCWMQSHKETIENLKKRIQELEKEKLNGTINSNAD